jgi:hypothetical protein
MWHGAARDLSSLAVTHNFGNGIAIVGLSIDIEAGRGRSVDQYHGTEAACGVPNVLPFECIADYLGFFSQHSQSRPLWSDSLF